MKRSKRRRRTVWISALLIVYVASYAVMSALGGWHWSQTGKLRYGFGFPVTDVIRWKPAGLTWEPFRNVAGDDTSRGNPQGYLYSPLIRIDRAWFHPDRPIFNRADDLTTRAS